MFTISLSLSAICAEILAESALRHHLQPSTPAPLTSDSTDALRTLITAAFASICTDLGPLAVSADISSGGELLQLTIDGNPQSAQQLRLAIEHLLALRVMTRAYASADSSLAASLSSSAASLLRSLAATISSSAPDIPVITPRFY